MSPAIINTTSSRPSSSKPAMPPKKASNQQPQQHHSQKPVARKSRVARRRPRARARVGDLESDEDEEIARDASSDDDVSVSGTSDDDSDSATDSETASGTDEDSASESDLGGINGHGRVRNGCNKGRRHVDTPSTTQSPPPGETIASLNSLDPSKIETIGAAKGQPKSAFPSVSVDWSNTAVQDGANESESVPVIDFADLNENAAASIPTVRPRKARKPKRSTTDATGSVTVESEGARAQSVEEGDANTQNDTIEKTQRGGHGDSRGSPRPRGQSARQAYQQRLQTDPSFVPTVGEFWGHDDRLLQKDLRSLSGWWRGRWRGRGRGGYSGQGLRGRGRGARGGYVHGTESGWVNESGEVSGSAIVGDGWPTADTEVEVPPIEKAWTHDGYEELKKTDEQKRDEQKRRPSQQRPASLKTNDKKTSYSAGAKTEKESVPDMTPASPATTNASHHIRTSTPTRGRGRGGSLRGRTSPLTSRVRAEMLGEPWFSMKPERIWTKQFEGYLYSDPALKPKAGKPANLRVLLPGKETKIVPEQVSRKGVSASNEGVTKPLSEALPSDAAPVSDIGSKKLVVKVPKRVLDKGKGRAQPEPQPSFEAPVEAVQQIPSPEPIQTNVSLSVEIEEQAAIPQSAELTMSSPVEKEVMATPSLTRDNSLSERSFGDVPNLSTLTSALVLDTKTLPDVAPAPSGPVPPMQAPYPSPMQPSPTYTSPYIYPHSLPHGIGLSQQGFAFELASGRPVYLHPTPPPITMYNPHPMPFVPGHMHHPSSMSISSDYMPGPATPPLNSIYDPQTGQPIFSFPRQSSRIEIRAPDEAKPGKSERRPSALRRTTTAEQQEQPDQDSGSASSSQPLQPPQLPGAVQYVHHPEFYPDMTSMSQTYQPSEGASSLSPGNEERVLAVQGAPPMDPNMIGYNPYLPQQYYYPEQFYPSYVEMTQVPPQPIQPTYGQYDTYANDPHHQAPVYF